MKKATRAPLAWQRMVRPDGSEIEQARARNNSWYLIVPSTAGGCELRYASQSADAKVSDCATRGSARRAAEVHADRYDTRV